MIDRLRSNISSQLVLIRNVEIREFTRRVLEALPEAFWFRESSKKYHPAEERGECGNLIHSLKVNNVSRVLADIIKLSQEDLDVLSSASLLHDGLRHGLSGSDKYTCKEHPYLVRQLVKERKLECQYSDRICAVIETHMGPWSTPPYLPQLDLNSILFLADYIATQPFIKVEI